MDKNKDIDKMLDEFIAKVRNDDTENINRLVDDIFEYYSNRISEAINPINAISLPFIYRTLKEYTEMFEEHFPDSVETARCFENTKGTTIIIPKK